MATDRHLIGEIDTVPGHDYGPRSDIEDRDGCRRAVMVWDGVQDVQPHDRREVTKAHPLSTTNDVEGSDADLLTQPKLPHS